MCRTFEREINKHYGSFNPDGLEKYWGDRNKENTKEALLLIDSILHDLKRDVKNRLDVSFWRR